MPLPSCKRRDQADADQAVVGRQAGQGREIESPALPARRPLNRRRCGCAAAARTGRARRPRRAARCRSSPTMTSARGEAAQERGAERARADVFVQVPHEPRHARLREGGRDVRLETIRVDDRRVPLAKHPPQRPQITRQGDRRPHRLTERLRPRHAVSPLAGDAPLRPDGSAPAEKATRRPESRGAGIARQAPGPSTTVMSQSGSRVWSAVSRVSRLVSAPPNAADVVRQARLCRAGLIDQRCHGVRQLFQAARRIGQTRRARPRRRPHCGP